MTEINAKRTDHVRMITNYTYYDNQQIFRSFSKGAITTDSEEIKFLEAQHAPIERIEA
jgi:hypothetical protein